MSNKKKEDTSNKNECTNKTSGWEIAKAITFYGMAVTAVIVMVLISIGIVKLCEVSVNTYTINDFDLYKAEDYFIVTDGTYRFKVNNEDIVYTNKTEFKYTYDKLRGSVVDKALYIDYDRAKELGLLEQIDIWDNHL